MIMRTELAENHLCNAVCLINSAYEKKACIFSLLLRLQVVADKTTTI